MRAILLLAALSLTAAGHAADRSYAVYPRQTIPLRFTHQQHLDLDMKCISCHDVDESTRADDRNIPPQSVCEGCHEIEAAAAGEETDPPSACTVCHPGFDPSARKRPPELVLPTAHLHFDHKVHLDRNVACASCHGDLRQVQLATRAQLPKMESCLECHGKGGEASGECTTCHLARANGMVETALPQGARLIPEIGNPFGVAHGPRYEREHGADATTRRAVCASCHTESDCLACHDGTFKNLKFHPNDWITLHPVPAKMASLECTSCHREQSFCVTCHERAGLSRGGPSQLRPTEPLRFHPEGWEDLGPGPGHHAYWASRDIGTCVSCHREEDCIACHATAGRQGSNFSPHPPGFAAQALSMCRRNPRVCVKCHERDRFLQGCL